MGKLILYSLAAHLIVVGLVFTVPLVSERRVEPRKFYRVSFVELPGSAPLEKAGAPDGGKKSLPKSAPQKKAPSSERKEKAGAHRSEKKEPLPAPRQEAKKAVAPLAKTESAGRKAEAGPPKAGEASPRKEAILKQKDRRRTPGEPPAPAGLTHGPGEPGGGSVASITSLGPRGVGKVSLEDVDFP
ncbi:MAG: hypothetical protein ACE5JL_19605, partial [Dehalococcoidia bacterium]